MSTYNAKCYVRQDGDAIIIEAGGSLIITGAITPSSGTQASAIADLTAATGTADGTIQDVTSSFDQTILNNNFKDLATKVNGILAAIRGVGIIAT